MNFLNSLPPYIKILICFILAGIIFSGILTLDNIKDLVEQEDLAKIEKPNIIDLGFVVRDENNNPLENVNISFQGNNFVTERKTNTDGYVKISLPQQTELEIIMIKKGFKTKKITFNTNIDREKTITYYLEEYIDKSSKKIQDNTDASITNNCSKSTKIDNFEISLYKCEKSQSVLIFYFYIKNIERPREISLYAQSSRIIDSRGKIYYGIATYIGNPSWNNNSRNKIPSNITIEAALKFNDILVPDNKINLIELNTSISKIEFRDINISNT